MTTRFALPAEFEEWNKYILANPDGGNIFQGNEFANQKQTSGWTTRFIVADSVAITVLEKNVLGLGKLWYLPKGPGITSVDQLQNILTDLRPFAQRNGVFAIKIEPELQKTPEIHSNLLGHGLHPVSPIQPNFSTILLDLSPDLDTILNNLNQKGRHAIRRAERDGVTIKRVESTDENCKIMYQLLSDTAAGSFRIRYYNYYKTFWQRYSNAELGQLFFAYVGDQVVAAAYAITFGAKSTYKDGASIRERVVYGASHLLQWEVITWAKERGSLVHDLCGAPPSDQINNPDHPHYGIGRFKTSFNKQVTDYVGAYDLPIRPLQYKLWTTVGERLAVRLHNQRHHESWY